MKLYCVYILECKDQYLYTGVTNNISRRLLEHQKGLNKECFTFKRRPIKLVFHQEFNTIEQAISFEKKIKKWSRTKKTALVNGDFDLLPILSECKNESHSRNIDLDSARSDMVTKDFFLKNKSKIEQLTLPILEEKGITLSVKREDLIHPIISGNKYRKLFYNIEEAKRKGCKQLLTFGGAYSNHILATAGAGAEFGFKTVGVIRGEELGLDLEKTLATNPTLKEAHELGMELCFISRSDYKLKTTTDFLSGIQEKHGNSYILPEGGTNDLAIKGCEAILGKETEKFDIICSAVGTGGTISGIINASLSSQQILGFPALKGDFLKDEIENNKVNKSNWKLITDYHFGGYAKIDKELITFNNNFQKTTNILLDPIYTGKMFYGIIDMIQKDKFPNGTKILMIHTGGLQGIKGMNTTLKKKGLPLLINRKHE